MAVKGEEEVAIWWSWTGWLVRPLHWPQTEAIPLMSRPTTNDHCETLTVAIPLISRSITNRDAERTHGLLGPGRGEAIYVDIQ